MKKAFFFLVFVLAVQMNYKIVYIFSQDDKDVLAIKSVIKAFVENQINGDVDSAMQSVSANYSSKEKDDTILDYAKLKSLLKNEAVGRSEKYTGYSIYNFEIVKSDIKNNSAIVEYEFNWKRFNLDTLKDESGISKRRGYLEKENGTWKITQRQFLSR